MYDAWGRSVLISGPSRAVVLRALEPTDAADLLELRRRNRHYFAPSEPLRDHDWLTLQRQRSELEAEADARAAGRSLSFGVFADDVLVGRLALTSIARSVSKRVSRLRDRSASHGPRDRDRGSQRGDHHRVGSRASPRAGSGFTRQHGIQAGARTHRLSPRRPRLALPAARWPLDRPRTLGDHNRG